MTDLITKEWQVCWDTMRDVGDEAANKTLSSLVMKDKFDQSRVVLDGTNSDGWTLFHKAALHNCLDCGLRILENASKIPKDQEYGGPAQVLEYLNKTTSNGSTALMISQRWKENDFSKMLNKQKLAYEALAKIEAKEEQDNKEAYEKELRQYNNEYSDEEDDNSYNNIHSQNNNNNKANELPLFGADGKINLTPVAVEYDMNAPYGGRSEPWWDLWHGFHNNRNDVHNDLKDFFKTAHNGFEELSCVSTLPSTAGMTLLHQAALNGMAKSVGYMLRSGAYGGSTSDPCQWCFDLKGRTPREVALRHGRKECIDVLDEHSQNVSLKLRKKLEKKLSRINSSASLGSPSTPGSVISTDSIAASLGGGGGNIKSLRSDLWWNTWHSLHSNHREESLENIQTMIEQYEIEFNIHLNNYNNEDEDDDQKSKKNKKNKKLKNKSKEIEENEEGILYDDYGNVIQQSTIPELSEVADMGYASGITLLEQAASNGNSKAVSLLLNTQLFPCPSRNEDDEEQDDNGAREDEEDISNKLTHTSVISLNSSKSKKSISFAGQQTSFRFDDENEVEEQESGKRRDEGNEYETFEDKLVRKYAILRALKNAQFFNYIAVSEVIQDFLIAHSSS